MAEISAAAVRALRERTNLPMMDCKKALTESGGDETKAIAWLKERNKGKLEERSGNATGEGRMFVKVADDHSAAAIVEIQCESSPVANSESLRELAAALVDAELKSGDTSPDSLLAQPAPNGSGTLQEMFDDIGGKIREKIVVARVKRVPGPVGMYIHHDGKTAVLVQVEGAKFDPDISRDVAMHVAAMRPTVTLPEQLNVDEVAEEKSRLMEEARKSGKPENILEKIIDGQLKRFYSEKGVLTHQLFAKDDTKTVSQALAEKGLKAKDFTLWVLGGN